MDEEIKIINRTIAEAVIHGADAGGSYDQNERNLIGAIDKWLQLKGLDSEYVVEEESVPWDGIYFFTVPQIVRKNGE